MTEKLYYADGYLHEFDARILRLETFRGNTAIVLDKTAFFPEGGGQPGDSGSIGDVFVIDTQIEQGIIYHIVKDPGNIDVTGTVRCAVDFQKRFARMQAHTGEHIVSGIAHAMFGVNNVGFHMDDTVMTVDFDHRLSKEQLNDLELSANECVYGNAEVVSWYPADSELNSISFRSKIDDLEHPRIVTIRGYDQCACCAVHVARTGEVGIIKILTAVSHRGGVRLTLICGITAYRDYVMKHAHTLRIADLLASKHGETDAAVERQLQKEKDLRWQLQQRTDALIAYVKKNEPQTTGNRVFCFEKFDPETLKTAAVSLKEICGGLCVVISGDDRKGYYFAITSASVNVNCFTKTIVSALNGSGGGRFDVIQGRFHATESEIKAYFSELTVN